MGMSFVYLNRSGAVLIGLALLLLAGCRSYGGYGAEEETRRQMHEANRLSGEHLQRARGTLAALQRESAGRPGLQPLVEEFQATVLTHEVLLRHHQELLARVDAPRTDYREVRRVFASMLTDQESISRRYQAVLDHASDPELALRGEVPAESRYVVAPPFYARLQQARSADATRPRPAAPAVEPSPADHPAADPGVDASPADTLPADPQ
jgi:hypothetical protein